MLYRDDHSEEDEEASVLVHSSLCPVDNCPCRAPLTADERFAKYQEMAWTWRLSNRKFMSLKNWWPSSIWWAEYDRRQVSVRELALGKVPGTVYDGSKDTQ